MDKNKKPKKLQKLKNKYRLVILNDDSFEEKYSLRLSRLNVFAVSGTLALLLILLVTIIIAFTPLREFIPGYTDVKLRQTSINNSFKIDSLQNVLIAREKYINNIKLIFQGKPINYVEDNVVDSLVNYNEISDTKSIDDSLLRDMIEKEEKYNLFSSANRNSNNISSFFFFTPLKGTLTSSFNAKNSHFGVDIVAPEKEAVKATLNGTVIFAEWNPQTGYVIQLQHSNNLISIYKHNEVLHKEVGDNVKAGEVIAIVGNSGELSTGPHLHFELWYKGLPLNPEDYIVF